MAQGMRSGRRRRIRELLKVLDDPNQLWRPIHTDMLVQLYVNQGSGEREQFDSALAKRMRQEQLEHKRALIANRKAIFHEELEAQLPKVAKALELLTDYGFHKAIDPETGEIDLAKLSDKDAKVALQAMGLTLKSLGLLTTKVAVETGNENVFDAEAVEE